MIFILIIQLMGILILLALTTLAYLEPIFTGFLTIIHLQISLFGISALSEKKNYWVLKKYILYSK